jgi:hypothetical protein
MNQSEQYANDLARHPNCQDPDHPGCPHCEPEKPWKALRLTQLGQDYYTAFNQLDGCYCHLTAPCSYCMHEGHPINLIESSDDEEVWAISCDPDLTLHSTIELEA